MSDKSENAGKTVVLSVFLVVSFVIVVVAFSGPILKPTILNCMPLTVAGNDVRGNMPNKKENGATTEAFAPVNPYFDPDQLKPMVNSTDPDWAKKYGEATSGLMDQNYVDNADPRKYTMTRSTCGRRYMSLDLRRVPVPTRDPTTVTSFGLPYIPPECVRQWQNSRPPLDC